jgi:hypothetical protein
VTGAGRFHTRLRRARNLLAALASRGGLPGLRPRRPAAPGSACKLVPPSRDAPRRPHHPGLGRQMLLNAGCAVKTPNRPDQAGTENEDKGWWQ